MRRAHPVPDRREREAGQGRHRKKRLLTPAEQTACRIAGYLGCSPSEVEELPAADYDLLQRYWEEEPWGAWRDNMHAAMICREVRRIRWPKTSANLSTWMLVTAARRAAGHVQDFKSMLINMAGGVRKHVSQAIKRPVRRKAKKADPK